MGYLEIGRSHKSYTGVTVKNVLQLLESVVIQVEYQSYAYIEGFRNIINKMGNIGVRGA